MQPQVYSTMKAQPLFARVIVVSTVLALGGCNTEAGDDPITGENSLVKELLTPVFDADGNNLTAINQTNFPLPPAEPTVSAALPDTDALGGDSGEDDGDSGDAEAPATGGLANGAELDRDNYYDDDSTVVATTDPLGVRMGGLLLAVGGTVAEAYAHASGSTVFSDGTESITKRIAEKSACDSGTIDADFVMNGAALNNGSLEYADCSYNGTLLNGLMIFSTLSVADQDTIVVEIVSVSAVLPEGEVLLTGSLAMAFNGNAFAVLSENISTSGADFEHTWEATNLTGGLILGGERVLSGSTRMVDAGQGGSIDLTFSSVSAVAGSAYPNFGTQTHEHSDGSSVQFDYDAGDATVFDMTVTRQDGSSSTYSRDWSTVQTRIPF